MSESDIDLFLDHWIIIRKDGTPVLNGNPEVFEAALKELSDERAKERNDGRFTRNSTQLRTRDG